MSDSNLGYLTDAGVTSRPDKIALIQEHAALSYAQLEERANQVANGLRDLGVRSGERVLLVFPNDHRYVEALLGTLRAGAVAVPAGDRLGYERLEYIARDSGAVVLIVTSANVTVPERLRASCPSLREVVVIDGRDGGWIDYDDWLTASSAERAPVGVRRDDLCMQPYTSGSSGKPKGVLLQHRGQLHNAEAVRHVMEVREWHRSIISVPLFHSNAMSGALFPFLLACGSAVVVPRFDAAAVLEQIGRWRCTHMTGVPAMYNMITQHDFDRSHDTESLEVAVCGSAPVPPRLLSELEHVFPNAVISEGYGLTEGGPVVFRTPRSTPVKLGSAGFPLPGVEVKLVRGDGSEPLDGEVGELWVRSAGNARGYHNLPGPTADRFTGDGWFKTGDVVRRDRDGYYYFVGRRDDMMNCGGENVYPKEVESLLLQHPHVRDVCVVAAPHSVKGEVPVAFVVPTNGVTEVEIKQFFLERGAPYAHPRSVVFLDDLPLLETGKPDRALLAKRAQAGRATTEPLGAGAER